MRRRIQVTAANTEFQDSYLLCLCVCLCVIFGCVVLLLQVLSHFLSAFPLVMSVACVGLLWDVWMSVTAKAHLSTAGGAVRPAFVAKSRVAIHVWRLRHRVGSCAGNGFQS